MAVAPNANNHQQSSRRSLLHASRIQLKVPRKVLLLNGQCQRMIHICKLHVEIHILLDLGRRNAIQEIDFSVLVGTKEEAKNITQRTRIDGRVGMERGDQNSYRCF